MSCQHRPFVRGDTTCMDCGAPMESSKSPLRTIEVTPEIGRNLGLIWKPRAKALEKIAEAVAGRDPGKPSTEYPGRMFCEWCCYILPAHGETCVYQLAHNLPRFP